MRYAYGITAALLVGGTAMTLALQNPVGAQQSQNPISAAPVTSAPRAGAPMSFADLAARLQPAVVNISTTQKIQVNGFPGVPQGSPFEEFFRQFGGGGQPVTREATSLGSGFIISADGYVVTNNHVISGGQPGRGQAAPVESITVTLTDRTEYKARVVGRDPLTDLAVLKIDAKNLPYVQFGDSTNTRVGDWVVAIGNPFGLGGTVTAGIVSALHRNIGASAYDRYIQTDASINQGNSGGPMFDLAGNVIGVNTAIFSPTGGNVGIGFAIPSEQAKPVIDALKSGGGVKRGYLGIAIQPMTEDIASSLGLPKDRGEIVARVEPGEAAAQAGIRQGDVIIKVNGRDITPDDTLSYQVANLPIGKRIPVELIRNGKRMTVTATIAERPSEQKIAATIGGDFSAEADSRTNEQAAQSGLGLSLQALSPQIARQLRLPETTKGVVIAGVDPASHAAQEGLQRGDVILSINQQPVTSPQEASAVVNEARKAQRDRVLLLVQRGPSPARYIGIKMNARR